MATTVIMPRQGQSVESCVIGQWHKRVGERVAVGDLLFTYETDKAAFDEEAKVDGLLLAIFFGEGDDVPCLETVGAIGEAGEDVSALRPGAARNASTTLRSSARSIGGPVKREIERIWRISEPMTVASSPGSPP